MINSPVLRPGNPDIVPVNSLLFLDMTVCIATVHTFSLLCDQELSKSRDLHSDLQTIFTGKLNLVFDFFLSLFGWNILL